jgi:hypothetical protein
MGRILALNPPYQGLSTIVNVLARVGPTETNTSDDVRVVQRLLQMCARGSNIGARIGMPQPTGNFDAATGFWIFYTQAGQRRGVIVDGIVSPAHGAHYAPGGGVWTIVIFNYLAKNASPQEYAALVAESST